MSWTLLHAADAHLGYAQYGLRERQQDFARAFATMAQEAIAQDVRAVLLAGDLFHKRTVDANTLYQAVSVLEMLRAADIQVIAVEGNHERPHFREPLSWLDFLARMDLLVLLAPEYHQGKLALLPWDPRECRGGYIDLPHSLRIIGCRYVGASTPAVVADLALAIPQLPEADSRHTILMLHAGMEGVLDAYSGTLRESDLLPLRDWVEYVALGHIHKPYERLGWAFNPGSLEANSATESQWTDRGYLLIEVDAEDGLRLPPERVTVQGRPFLRLSCHVDDLQRPTALWERVRTIASETTLDADDARKPIVELTLRGQLGFPRGALEPDRIEAILDEAFDPLIVRVRDLTTQEPGEIDIDAELTRRELAHRVLSEMISQDPRLRDLAEPMTDVALNIQELALADSDPADIATSLERWQSEHGRPLAEPLVALSKDEP
ncbi:MAG: metallophosphoesterase family protein [Anaerolineae bacterium]